MNLRELFEQNPGFLLNAKAIRGLFNDVYQNDMQKVNIMMSAYGINIVKELVAHYPADHLEKERLVKSLRQNYSVLKAMAEWAVNEWSQSISDVVISGLKSINETLEKSNVDITEDSYWRSVSKHEMELWAAVKEQKHDAEYYRKKKQYDATIESMNHATDERQFITVANVFKSFGDFEDAQAMAQLCEAKAKDARYEAIYQWGLKNASFNSSNAQKDAIACFKQIPGWKDADYKVKACTLRYNELLKKEREFRREEERIKRRKRMRIIALFSTSIFFALWSIKYIYPSIRYNYAIKMMDSGKFDTAIPIFASLGEYKSADAMLSECESRKAQFKLLPSTPSPTPTPKKTATPKPTRKATSTPKKTATPTPKKTATPTPRITATRKPTISYSWPAGQNCTVTSESLNVRSGPSPDYAWVDGLSKGDKVKILAYQLGEDGVRDWYLVELAKGKTGWISSNKVKHNGYYNGTKNGVPIE